MSPIINYRFLLVLQLRTSSANSISSTVAIDLLPMIMYYVMWWCDVRPVWWDDVLWIIYLSVWSKNRMSNVRFYSAFLINVWFFKWRHAIVHEHTSHRVKHVSTEMNLDTQSWHHFLVSRKQTRKNGVKTVSSLAYWHLSVETKL